MALHQGSGITTIPYPWRPRGRRHGVTKIAIDINDEALERAARLLGTKTTDDTVNAALRVAALHSERARALKGLGEMTDRGDFDEFLAGQP
jgi:Arc/MetJ family transcription regulator